MVGLGHDGRELRVDLPGGGDAGAVAAGEALALVGHQLRGAPVDEGGEVLRRRRRGRRDGGGGLGGMGDGPAADAEGLRVALDVGAVDLDGAEQRLLGERDEAGLPGGAEHEHVGVDGVAEELLGKAGGVEDVQGFLAEAGAKRQRQPVGGKLEAAVAGEVAGDDLVGVEDGAGAAAGHEAEGLGAGGGDEVAADQRVGLADRHADGGDGGRGLGDAAVDVDRAALLGEAGHLHLAGALALEVGGHGDQRADGDDAGAADAGDDDVVGAADGGERGRGQVGERQRGLRRLADLRALERDEAGAEALRGRRSPCCRTTGRSRACGRTRSPAAGSRRSSTARRSRRSPRRRPG